MNRSFRERLWLKLLAMRLPIPGLLICLQLQGFGGAGMREAYADAEIDDTPVLSEVDLRVTPTSCVALHRGQVCFQRLQLRWKNPEGRRLCLFNQAANEPLFCTAVSPAEYRHEYRSDESEEFILREATTDDVLAKVTVTTAWVYRTGKRSSSGWRLF